MACPTDLVSEPEVNLPALIFLGWIIGISLAGLLGGTAVVGFGGALPSFLAVLAGPVAAIISILSTIVAALLAMLLIVIVYIIAYFTATWAIASYLPTIDGNPHYPTSATTVPVTAGEYFARGVMVGLTAGLNLLLLALIPLVGLFLGGWAFALISMGGVILIARNRVYQGFLGWAAWLFPMSYIATAVGLLLFVVNFAFSFAALGLNAFRIDWTTGVITSSDGILTWVNGNIAPLAAGFSLGNFVFLDASPGPDEFTEPGVPSHETGHSLNTALAGGIVLWINAVDENFGANTARQNLAYGELLAEGHSRAMPGTAMADYSHKLWY